MTMAEESGPGFTSLPVNEPILRKRLDRSQESFSGTLKVTDYAKYLMILEDLETGAVGGCSAVKTGIGIKSPFFNYRIVTLAHSSSAADRRYNMDALVLTNEFMGYTEVGTLFLRPNYRSKGVGRLIAQSRYLLMQTSPEHFGERILAELRGVVSDDGKSPFWEALGAHFFRMSFQEADSLSATTDNQFIMDLMPKYPIYIDLLPDDAREVVGRCHAQGVPAYKMLMWEGFRFDRVVDIFDSGPLVVAQREMIRTCRESALVKVDIGDAETDQGLIATTDLRSFRAANLSGALSGDTIFVSQDSLDALRLKRGDTARIWIKD